MKGELRPEGELIRWDFCVNTIALFPGARIVKTRLTPCRYLFSTGFARLAPYIIHSCALRLANPLRPFNGASCSSTLQSLAGARELMPIPASSGSWKEDILCEITFDSHKIPSSLPKPFTLVRFRFSIHSPWLKKTVNLCPPRHDLSQVSSAPL